MGVQQTVIGRVNIWFNECTSSNGCPDTPELTENDGV